MVRAIDNIKAAEGSRCGVVGMSFKVRANLEEILTRQGTLAEFIQSLNGSKAHGYTATESPRSRNIAANAALKWKGFATCSGKEGIGGGLDHPVRGAGSTAYDRDLVIKLKRDPEAVESWSEIRRTSRDSDGDLVHDFVVNAKLGTGRHCSLPGLVGKRCNEEPAR